MRALCQWLAAHSGARASLADTIDAFGLGTCLLAAFNNLIDTDSTGPEPVAVLTSRGRWTAS
jgi:hypothetical protein